MTAARGDALDLALLYDPRGVQGDGVQRPHRGGRLSLRRLLPRHAHGCDWGVEDDHALHPRSFRPHDRRDRRGREDAAQIYLARRPPCGGGRQGRHRDPALYYVHTDHLGRPARMMAQNWAWVWDVIYAPFCGTAYLWDATTRLDIRFPGQWFQLESGLAYNWHRHYDATLGRYVQPDPLRVDEKEGAIIQGLPSATLLARASRSDLNNARDAAYAPSLLGQIGFSHVDGPSLFSYGRLNPLAIIDPSGLAGLDRFEEMKVQQFCGQFCQGKVLKEIPGQFLECTVGDVIAAAKSGDSAARKAYKLLNDNRFRK
jgi:RHS repeat-associated protein